jgi:hypothetical protein
MLGIRRFQGVALDLFQGEPRLFHCDQMLHAADITTELAAADALSRRHVAIADATDPEQVFHDVKVYLEGERSHRGIERLTLVLASLEQYYEFQDVMFRTFPDAP